MSAVSILHYLFRSSMVLSTDAGAEVWEYFQDFSRICMGDAARLAYMGGLLPRPVWVDEFKQKLVLAHPGHAEQIDQVSIATVIRPQILAFSYPGRRLIEISAVSREHLRSINLLLWTVADSILNPESRPDGIRAGEKLLDLLLPWIFALYYHNTNYSRLPILRAPSYGTFGAAQRLSHTQVEFMLAHEFAHMLLHSGKPFDQALEVEADGFAYDLLFDAQPFVEKETPFLTFMALRWLFLYLSLDRIVGAVLADYPVDWIEIPIRDRELPFLRRAGDLPASRSLQRVWQLGDLLLFQAKGLLYERGPLWLKKQADEFRENFCFPANGPS
ncbi:uncharacterized protein DUF955 [Kribbella kalugense]|uniref:Uncharacterized protein DUF955 n=2 Tax=Kribbella kalugense TaxID=2512221 RepID=A0A4R7ZLA8_9ACTN|nr:uncharacterized protein DUF955 [Kribbella kalugense]